MARKTFVTIMAGGIGSRFWPLSRKERPKQFLDLLGVGKSLLQMTYERFSPIFNDDEIFIITSDHYVDLVKQQLPQLNERQILAEPQRKNTAPCIAYAAFKLQSLYPNSNMVVTPADHLILEIDDFLMNIQEGIAFADSTKTLVTLGIQPTTPHTGYGYIQFSESDDRFKPVKTFTEKPSLEFAKEFIDSGEFLWNSGIFIWNTSTVLKAFQNYMSDVYDAFEQVEFNTEREDAQVRKAYSYCPSISVDYGILEKYEDIYVLPAFFSWSDLGTWQALHEIDQKDEHNNVKNSSRIQLKKVGNSIVHSLDQNKLIVLQDVENLIVVDTEDALVICHKNSEQKLKDIVTSLSTKGLDKYL